MTEEWQFSERHSLGKSLFLHLAPGIPFTLAFFLAASTVLRNLDYRSEVALWESAAARSPGKGRVWNNLGFARQQAGDLRGAREAYERAIALDPQDYRAQVNLGTLEAEAAGVPGNAPAER